MDVGGQPKVTFQWPLLFICRGQPAQGRGGDELPPEPQLLPQDPETLSALGDGPRLPGQARFSVMVRSLGLHQIGARSYWGLVARVNLIRKVASLTLVHNLTRSMLLLRMAGVEP